MLTGPTPQDLLLFDEQMTTPLIEETGIGTMIVYSDRRPGNKTVNEDSAAILALDRRSLLLIVADGVGGRGSGEQASRTAVLCIQSAVEQAIARNRSIDKAVIRGIGSANQKLHKMNNGAATTLAAVHVLPGVVRTYHAGDSRVVIIGGPGRKNHQTIDHSRVNEVVTDGAVNHAESNGHANRHIVTNAIGLSQTFIDVGARTEIHSKDTVLLATDGLFDNLDSDELLNLVCMRSISDTAETILEIARSRMTNGHKNGRGKPDDLTFILFRPKPRRLAQGRVHKP